MPLFCIGKGGLIVIQIDINKTGFPIKFGEIDLWFDSSLENLRTFLNYEEIAEQKIKEAQEKAKKLHFPDVIEKIEDVEVETIDAAFDVNKEFIKAQYDTVLGDGTFDKIHSVYNDIVALDDAMGPLFVAIANKINEQVDERNEEVKEIKAKALKKQKTKRGG